jgi:hypothetical protein
MYTVNLYAPNRRGRESDMFKRTTIRLVSLLCVLVAAGSALGQTGLGDSFPYTGQINGTSVRVRAGRGDPSGANNYYYCAVLDTPAKVTVIAAKDGWLAVLPPEGCYSVVLQSSVKADATGTKGTMIKREWARAAGTARTLQFTAGQKILKPGDSVEILGTVTDRFKFYKIKTPKKVPFWIYAKLVSKVGAEAVVVTPVAPTTQPAGAGATTRPAKTAAGSNDSSVTGVTAAEMKAFKGVQAALKAEYSKDVVERDYSGLVDKFKALEFKEAHPLAPFVDYYVKYIENDMSRLASIKSAKKLSDDAAKAQKEIADARKNIVVEMPKKKITCDAEGIIAESRMFSGVSAVQKRYIVYSEKTHRLNAYIYASDQRTDLGKLVGKHVAVFGDSRYDKGLGANVVDVKRAEVIDGKTRVPVLRKPIVLTKPKEPVTPPAVIVKPIPLINLVPTTRPAVVPDPVIKPKPAPIIKPEPIVVPKPKPEPVIVPKPEPVIVPKPEPVIVPKPEPVIVPKPEPVVVPKPEPVIVPKPEPVIVPKPEPVIVPKPEPVIVPKPEPVIVPKPEPVIVPKPEPVVVPKPEPVIVPKPEPVIVPKPKPEPVVVPKPIDPGKPIPTPLVRPLPIKPIGPLPTPVVKPRPIDVGKPIVPPTARPLPTTKRPSSTTKPATLIDLETITRKNPTTRPAPGSIEAIPEPKKPVDAGDFPMPLPPSGLPLVEVKEAPTTMPVDESEFE